MVTAVDGHDFVQRCDSMVEGLAERADEAEVLRRLPPDTIAAARDADLLRCVVPSELGGSGLGLRELAHGTRTLAHGCPASAWTLSFFMLHAWLLAGLPASGRGEVFSAGPTPLAPAPLAPTGRAVPVEGGFLVSGSWDWATGVCHADWVMVHTVQTGPDLTTRFAVLPIDSVQVQDVWFTSGMRATGSNRVLIDSAFVPESLTIEARGLMDGTSEPLTGDGMAGLPVPPVLALVASAAAVGAAEAALETYRDRVSQRVLAYTLGERAVEQPAAQIRLAAAVADLRGIRALWDSTIDALVAAADDGSVDVDMRVRARLAAASVVRQSRRVIADICEGAGASVYMSDHPLQRLQRDVETLKGHVIFDWDRTAELAGRHELGLELRPTDLI